MMEFFLTIIVFFGVIALTALLFGGWVIVSIIRFIVRAVAGASSEQEATPVVSSVRCAGKGCHAENPAQARFCRRCGQVLPQAQRVAVRRAAMW